MNILYIWLLMIIGGLLLGLTIRIIKLVMKHNQIKREKEQLRLSRQILEEQRKQTEIQRQQYLNNIEKR